jgi:hypothetical protein
MTRHFGFLRALLLAALVLAALQWAQAHRFQDLEARIWWFDLRQTLFGVPNEPH